MAKASQVVIMEGEYYIIKSPNGKVLEVKDFNTENGAGIQLWSYAVHLFYDEFYSSFISVRHWNVQYGLCLFLQKLLNGCNHT